MTWAVRPRRDPFAWNDASRSPSMAATAQRPGPWVGTRRRVTISSPCIRHEGELSLFADDRHLDCIDLTSQRYRFIERLAQGSKGPQRLRPGFATFAGDE